MCLTATTTLAALLLLTGCSSAPKEQPDALFQSVRTIELKDETNPVLLASTNAKQIRDFVELGLKHRGYSVCTDCQADAIATVVVREYRTKQISKRDWIGWGNLNYFVAAESYWTFTIVRNGKTIFQDDPEDEIGGMTLEQLAGRQAREVLNHIPTRK